jgi:ABC-2 type transport system permease protein
MIAILKKELRQFFGSISGYFIISGFLTLNALWLWLLKTEANILNSGFADLTQFFASTAWFFIILIPTLTMRSFSDEKQSGTIEILKTKPVSSLQLICGKFFAILTIVLCALLPTFFYVFSIYQLAAPVGNIDFGSIIGSYIGLLFLASSFVAIGLWVSSFSKNQLIAVLTTIITSYFLFSGIQEFAYLFPDYNLEKLGAYAHFSSITRGVIDSRDLIYFLSTTLFFLMLTFYKVSVKKNKKKLIYSILILIAINSIGKQSYKRIDLTEDKKYTISTASVSILNAIDETAVIRVYLEGDFPPEFKRLQLETIQLLEELKAKNKHLKVLFINPKQDLEKHIKNGLTPSKLTVQENGIVSEMVILPWATLHYKNKNEIISLLKESAPKETQIEQLENSIQNLEYAFVNALKKASTKKEKSIAIIGGNGELDDRYLYSLLKDIGNYYHLAKFTLDSIAKNPIKTSVQLNTYDLAIIAKPTEAFSEEEKYSLDQYILNGGNTIWMVDNVYAEMDSLYRSGKTLAYPRNLNLDDFFFRYGARINQNLVKDLYASKIALATGNTGKKSNYQNFSWYYSPLVSTKNTHPIVHNITPVKLAFVSSIDTLKNTIKKTVLLQSSQLSKTIQTPAIIELKSVTEKPDPRIFNNGNQILGLLLEGEFTSAYKDRLKPLKLKNPKEIGIPSKMVLISDGDIAKNDIHQGAPLELGIDKWTQEHYGNKEFLLNTIEYLLDDSGLISIRSKNISLKNLDKKKVLENHTYWQFINLFIPLLITAIFGVLFFYYRRKKYGKATN